MWKSKVLVFEEEPVKKEKDEECTTTCKQDRGGFFNGFENMRIAAECCGERFNGTEAWGCKPNDDPWQESAHHHDRKDNSPKQKPFFGFCTHGVKNFGVDDRVVDRRDGFKKTQTGDNKEDRKDVHNKYS